MSRRVRLTKFGYIVSGSALAVLILILVLVICIVSCNKKAKVPSNSQTQSSESTGNDLINDGENSEDGEDWEQDASVPDYSVQPDPVIPDVPDVPQDPVTPVPQITPEPVADVMRTPSPVEVENAQNAKLNNSGVALRNAPNTSGTILGKYSKNTRLVVYAESGDYYMVQVVKDNVYGFMAKKFIAIVDVTPTPTPSPTPDPIPDGAVSGTVSKTKVALRSAPDLSDDSNKIGELPQGAKVFVFYTYTNANGDPFYYIQVADKTSSHYGKMAFCYKTYLKVNGTVPTGTPNP